MKAVMLSIQPKYCSLIAGGKKTIEVRKTRPKLSTPFKCYIYCTKSNEMLWILNKKDRQRFKGNIAQIFNAKDVGGASKANGKVIGEFVCDKIYQYSTYNFEGINISDEAMTTGSCLSKNELKNYESPKVIKDFSVNLYGVYGWHISDLVIYDEPRELSEFYVKCDDGCEDCDLWKYVRVNSEEYDMDCSSDIYGYKPLKKPPQSWCYVKECENKG